jgi:glycosyltransferase involved in cell wall biosynthesis
VPDFQQSNSDVPAISVVVPCYNAAGTLRDAVASLLRQTIPVREILIVDNNSTDSSLAVSHELECANPGVVRLVCERKQGAAAARNRGVDAASSPWVAFLDADDEWLPEKIERCLPYLDGRYSLVCHDFVNRCDGLNRTIAAHVRSRILPTPYASLLLNNYIGTLTVIANRKSLIEAGGFPLNYINGEDYFLWLRVLGKKGAAAYILQEVLAVRNHRPGSVSRNRIVSQLWAIRARFAACAINLSRR